MELEMYSQKAADKCAFDHTLDTASERPKGMGGVSRWIGESIYVDAGTFLKPYELKQVKLQHKYTQM